jgi:hypothetical protein
MPKFSGVMEQITQIILPIRTRVRGNNIFPSTLLPSESVVNKGMANLSSDGHADYVIVIIVVIFKS